MAKINFPDKHLTEIKEFYEEELVKAKRRLEHIKTVLQELVEKKVDDITSYAKSSTKTTAKRGRPPKKKTGTSTTKRRGRPPKKKTETVSSKPKRRGRPPKSTSAAATKQTTTAKKTSGKAGRKSKWDKIIIEHMTSLGKPVTYEELTDDVMKAQKLPASKRSSTKQAIVNVIFRMRKRNDHVDTISLGSREKYVVLKSWCSSPGKLKPEFAKKVSEAPAATKPAAKKTTKTKKKTTSAKTTGKKRGKPPKKA